MQFAPLQHIKSPSVLHTEQQSSHRLSSKQLVVTSVALGVVRFSVELLFTTADWLTFCAISGVQR